MQMPAEAGTSKAEVKHKRVTTVKSQAKSKANPKAKRSVSRASARHSVSKAVVRQRPSAPSVQPVSFGQRFGLHSTTDPLDLRSSVAYVIDQDSNEVLFSKNSDAVLPIASLTKLMTAVVVTEAKLPLDEPMTITTDDIDTEKFSHSRLVVGTTLTREEMLHLALMSSENRAAHALGRYYPGGLPAFVTAMNAKARALGMTDTHYVEPTGLSSNNQSSAHDLAILVKAAHEFPIIREMSTSPEYQVKVGHRQLEFRSTNALVRSPQWDIGLQKTGYITEAGQCLLMQATLAGRKVIMVLLDSAGKYSRIGDAERIRKWILTTNPLPIGQESPSVTAGGVRITS